MSFVYGVLYLLFEAFPIVYSAAQPEGHGFNAGLTGLMFLPLFVGGAVAVAIYVFYFNPRYGTSKRAQRGKHALSIY